ncbi:MAG: 6-bladed beta-propeller [Spirochaetia bacterium]|jgi:DNA-binding beta-propeller fold protein YncE|nr:6-bladed beta-propeller [Spirochaetia bacterium]
MKKFSVVFFAVVIALAVSGCAGGTPDFTGFPADQGVIAPAVMFGEKADTFDAAAHKFTAPKPIAADMEGNIIVGGKAFDLSKFKADGTFVSIIGESGKGKGQWAYPKGLAVNKNGDIIVSDSKNLKILVFDKTGKFVREFGEKGDAAHQFSDLGPCVTDAEGNIYVSDEGAVTGIKKYTAEGKFVSVFVPIVADDVPGTKALAYSAIDDKLGRLYAGDDGDGDIDVYDLATGKLLMSIGKHGTGPGEFTEDIDGICVGPWNTIFAMNTEEGRIQAYTPEGKFITAFGKAGIYEGEMAGPEGIAYDAANNRIVVADEKNFRVQSFNLKDIGF